MWIMQGNDMIFQIITGNSATEEISSGGNLDLSNLLSNVLKPIHPFCWFCLLLCSQLRQFLEHS